MRAFITQNLKNSDHCHTINHTYFCDRNNPSS